MSKVIFLVADGREVTPDLRVGSHSDIFFTGIGNKNLEKQVESLIEKYKPDAIVNVGTCVSQKPMPTGTVRQFYIFVKENDKAAKPLYKSMGWIGTLIPEFMKGIFQTGEALQTVDEFVTKPDDMMRKFADMEAYHIALACRKAKVQFGCVKVVSDCAGKTSMENWEKALEVCAPVCSAIIAVIRNNAQKC